MIVDAAIVLAGGRSSRMGTDKLLLRLQGSSLLQRCCDAVAPHVGRIVVAGPERAGIKGVTFVTEDPPFGGPVAGITTAMAEVPGEGSVLLLAGDLAEPESVVETLLAHRARLEGADGLVLLDAGGWPQYLAGIYRAPALRAAGHRWPQGRDMSVRRFLAQLDCVRIPAPAAVVADIDTPAEAARLGASGEPMHDEETFSKELGNTTSGHARLGHDHRCSTP